MADLDPDKPKIQLAVGVDQDGFLALYDKVTGRQVGKEARIEVTLANEVHDVQTATFVVQTDPRLWDEEAIEKGVDGEFLPNE